ncbi:hypothetical protein GCM10027444_32670 [Actinopolyspora lacussalsi]
MPRPKEFQQCFPFDVVGRGDAWHESSISRGASRPGLSFPDRAGLCYSPDRTGTGFDEIARLLVVTLSRINGAGTLLRCYPVST